jgi:long-chain acyl-CoA synthetase
LGEEVGTTIYSTSDINVEELKSFLAQHIARFKIPRYFRFESEPLPRIASGKINKRSLRERAASELS